MVMIGVVPHVSPGVALNFAAGRHRFGGRFDVVGAIAAQTRSRGALFSAIAIPILLPLLVAASSATAIAFGKPGDVMPSIVIVAAYDAAMLSAAWLLFDFVWAP